MGEKILTFLGRSDTWIVGSALAVFLVLTWVLRGASVLQAGEAEEDADAPRAGYRDRIVTGVVVRADADPGRGLCRAGPGDPLVAADLRLGLRPGLDADPSQPPLSSRQPQPTPDHRFLRHVPEYVRCWQGS